MNQPPPTPVDVSLGSVDRNRFEALHGDNIQQAHIEPIIREEIVPESLEVHGKVPNAVPNKPNDQQKGVKFADNVPNRDINDENQQARNKQSVKEELDKENKTEKSSEILDEKQVEKDSEKQTEPSKKETKHEAINEENLESQETLNERVKEGEDNSEEINNKRERTDEEHNTELTKIDDNVVFFVTEKHAEKLETEMPEKAKDLVNSNETSESEGEEETATTNGDKTPRIESVIRVEVSESEKKEKNEDKGENEPDKAITSEDFPFTNNNMDDARDYMV